MRVTQMSAFSSAPPLNKPVIQQTYQAAPVKPAPIKGNIGKILSELKKDDYILLGIIAVLIWEGCDDYILLAALGYLFFMGVK